MIHLLKYMTFWTLACLSTQLIANPSDMQNLTGFSDCDYENLEGEWNAQKNVMAISFKNFNHTTQVEKNLTFHDFDCVWIFTMPQPSGKRLEFVGGNLELDSRIPANGRGFVSLRFTPAGRLAKGEVLTLSPQQVGRQSLILNAEDWQLPDCGEIFIEYSIRLYGEIAVDAAPSLLAMDEANRNASIEFSSFSGYFNVVDCK